MLTKLGCVFVDGKCQTIHMAYIRILWVRKKNKTRFPFRIPTISGGTTSTSCNRNGTRRVAATTLSAALSAMPSVPRCNWFRSSVSRWRPRHRWHPQGRPVTCTWWSLRPGENGNIMGKLYGKTMGKYGKTMGKYGKNMGIWWGYDGTMCSTEVHSWGVQFKGCWYGVVKNWGEARKLRGFNGILIGKNWRFS